ncbi:MAG TPA: FAD-binding oxidoreductase [Devosiaceae bacterium]
MTIFSKIDQNAADHPLHALYARFRGRLERPDSQDYDALRALPLANWDRKPALIARVADPQDIAAALEYARTTGTEVAVRSGGHSTGGFGACAGGIVIDVRDLTSLEIAEDLSSVWVGSGLTAGEVTLAVEKHGVIVGFGDSATVGVGGLTVGGGIGYLTRKHGLTIDSLLAVEIVTADGEIIVADADNHPDLFWAVRGGGGNFGVVTRFRFRLHPLPAFTGGPLVLPATPEVLAGFVAAAEAAPEELTAIVMVMPAPPMPFLPPQAIGQKVIIGMMAFAGPAEDAARALAPFRALAEPLADLVRPAPYSSMYMPEDPNMVPAVSIRTLFVDRIGSREAKAMIDMIDRSDAPMRMAQIRVLGGAAARIPVDATAYAHRNNHIVVSYMAMSGPDAIGRNEAWVDECLEVTSQGVSGAYVNFLADEGAARIRDAYPEATWARLRQVKRRYDPDNLFHLNQNIPPAEADIA